MISDIVPAACTLISCISGFLLCFFLFRDMNKGGDDKNG